MDKKPVERLGGDCCHSVTSSAANFGLLVAAQWKLLRWLPECFWQKILASFCKALNPIPEITEIVWLNGCLNHMFTSWAQHLPDSIWGDLVEDERSALRY